LPLNNRLDDLITSLPVWPRMETIVTPVTTFDDRRRSIRTLLETVKSRSGEEQSTGGA
jgi:hypothetical protein